MESDRLSFSIRPAIKTDSKSITEIDMVSMDKPWSFEDFDTHLEKENSLSAVAVCESSNLIAGFITGIAVEDEFEIYRLAVIPEQRRHGIGRSLIDFLIKELTVKGIKSTYLEVDSTNNPALNLYSKMGFKPVYTRNGYYSGTGSAVVMKKIL